MIKVELEEGQYRLYNVSYSWMPGFGGRSPTPMNMYYRIGYIKEKDLSGIIMGKHYSIKLKELKIVQRDHQVKQPDGLIYDSVYFKPKALARLKIKKENR